MYNKKLKKKKYGRFKSTTKTGDFLCLSLLLLGIPSTFLFVFIEVLPSFHQINSIFFGLACLAGIFIVFNIEGNLFACIFVDTTINSTQLTPPTDFLKLRDWHFCEDCAVLVPPRTWHCNSCRICILKRDHHCVFTGNCVGQRNQRYFIMLLIYLAVGSAASTIYMSLYIWMLNKHIYLNYLTFFKMLCPMLMVLMKSSWHNFYLLIYDLNIITCLVSSVLIVFHLKLILRGLVSYERNQRAKLHVCEYKPNLIEVFGQRMYLVWLSPFIKSQLPMDHQILIDKKN